MDTIAGYRLVRVLARGRHSEVWLGATRATDAAAAPVAIKLFHPGVPLTRIDTEVEALGRASHRHLQRLVDLSLDPDGRACLVLERLGTSLAKVLGTRGRLAMGEAVTALAPVALAVGELHRVGIAHGRIDAGSILFDHSGAPVLSCFGDATLVGEFPHPPASSSLTPAEAASQPMLRADRQQLASLTQSVLERTDDAGQMLGWVRQQSDGLPDFAAELVDRLFSSASATPVALTEAVERVQPRPLELRDSWSVAIGAQVAEDSASQEAGRAESLARLLNDLRTAVHLPEWLDSMLDGWLGTVRAREWVARGRAAVATVRKPVWVAAALGSIALVISATVLGGGAPSAEQPVTGSTSSVLAPTSAPVPTEPAGLHDTDPVAAARALLMLRDSCIRALSVLCLDHVNQPGSAAMDADRQHIRQHQQGVAPIEARDWAAAEIVLIEEFGDGALLDLVLEGVVAVGVEPAIASLLLVRTETGWLIRDLVH
ncbi:MAG: protein kinase [Cryobacterium sp.]|nr:protein kinase [Cryobacterium sp.]